MTDQHKPEPDVEQVTIWRNILDALGQLSAAWEAALEAQAQSAEGRTALPELPDELVTAFASAGWRGSQALTGVATVLAEGESTQQFAATAEAQENAERSWLSVYDGLADAQTEGRENA